MAIASSNLRDIMYIKVQLINKFNILKKIDAILLNTIHAHTHHPCDYLSVLKHRELPKRFIRDCDTTTVTGRSNIGKYVTTTVIRRSNTAKRRAPYEGAPMDRD